MTSTIVMSPAVVENPTAPALPVRRRMDVTGVNPLRARPRVQELLYRELLTPADLIAPILVQPDHRDPARYRYLPGAVSISEVAGHAQQLRSVGVRACKILVYIEHRTPHAEDALNPDNLMIAAIHAVRNAVPDMVIATEVCGCAWTDSGECVLLGSRGRTAIDATYELMARMAVLHAQAGVDIVGPAAVLDGSVQATRFELDEAGFTDVGVAPSVIFDSALFDIYKSAMNTDPGRGNRRGFQIDPSQLGQALDQAERWIDEGADSVLVQPAMTSIDLLTRLRGVIRAPLIAFSTSGEDQLFATAPIAVQLEYARALKRAGADLIMTYGALRLARALEDGQ
ncbi:hypothetical protein [Nocardia sp. NPDC051570]|uniref:hypothetical protein n=1 Tax=Nocardia sp. NPDC051570 TaxID=3364324 RepID=UPI0037AAD271